MADNVYYDPWSNTKTKNGLDADLVISALQKCIRRGEEELALRMAYELYITSTFHEEKMWNRLLVISVEDIGFGNTEAPVFVKTMNDLRKEFAYGDGDRPIFFMHAIRYLCKCKKERSTDHIKNIIMFVNTTQRMITTASIVGIKNPLHVLDISFQKYFISICNTL